MENQLHFQNKRPCLQGFQKYNSSSSVLTEKKVLNEANQIQKQADESNQKPSVDKEHYKQEALRLYLTNIYLNNQVKEIQSEKKVLEIRLVELQNQEREIKPKCSESNINAPNQTNLETETSSNQVEKQISSPYNIKKRFRRIAKEIPRHYICHVENCKKSYGSEGSLAQHLKLKHSLTYEAQKNSNLLNQNLQTQ